MTAPAPTGTPESPSTAASSAPPPLPPPAPTEWRVPDTDHRVWARGKTAAEILNITEQLSGALQQQQYQPPPVQTQSFDPSQVRDDDYVDGKTMRTYLQQVANPVVQRFGQLDQNLAQFALDRVKDRHADAFKRYGPEIDVLISRIPPEGRTVDNLTLAVDLVLGRHIEDEKRRYASEVGAPMDPTGRSYSASGQHTSAPGSLGRVTESDALPADYRDLLKAKNITDETVREFCAGQGITVAQWVEQAKKHNMGVITERSRRVQL